MSNPKHPLSLSITAVMEFLPALNQCVETSAVYFGLGKNEALKLCLAAEEIFSYLCSRVCRGKAVKVLCVDGLFFARVEFHFSVSSLDMASLNITTEVSFESDDDISQLGLVIAARTVDRLDIAAVAQNSVVLTIEQERTYPSHSSKVQKALQAKGELIVETPKPEDLMRFAMQVGMCQNDPLRPDFFKYPGKMADMVAAGHCFALVSRDLAGVIAGGILFRFLTDKIVEVFSPCIFDPSREEEISTLLLNTCIVKIARTKAVGLVSLTGLPASLRPQFESLGQMRYVLAGKAPLVSQAFCRLLHEDVGCQVWADPALMVYLEKEYNRLFLARDIIEVPDHQDARHGLSIISTVVRREKAEAFLHPLWPGRDFDENLARHAVLCKKKSLQNIFFAIDLGISWHAHLAPFLMSQSFKPCVLVPFAGKADLVIFQYDESEPK